MIESEPEFTTAFGRGWRLPVSFAAIGPASLVIDVVTIVLSSLVAGTAYSRLVYGVPGSFVQLVGLACMVAAIVVPLAKLGGLYTPARLLNVPRQAGAFLVLWIGALAFLTAVAFALKVGGVLSRGIFSTFALGGYGALIGTKAVWSLALNRALDSGRLRARDILLVGPPDVALSTASADFGAMGLRIARFLPLPAGSPGEDEVARLVSEAVLTVRGSTVREVFVTGGIDHLPTVARLLQGLRVLPLPVSFIPDPSAACFVGRPVHTIGTALILEVQRAPLALLEQGAKRACDVAIAATALVLLAPLMIAVALLVRLDSPGSILFRQQRRGFNSRSFEILKFRSMAPATDRDGVPQATRGDPRVTRVGRWLRRTSIDELPQLFNVLGGSMSLVGPRPHAIVHDTYYDEVIATYAFRHNVKPGLTGWAQVNGARGETPTVESMAARVEYDLWYIDNWSLWLDFGIMLRTLIVLGRANAY